MATLAIVGRSFEIGPYKLGALRRAAPHIDAINAINKAAGGSDTLEAMTDSAEHMAAIVAIGLEKLDPSLTAEKLMDELGFDDLPAIGRVVKEIMEESGFIRTGEAAAPSEHPAAEGALPNTSETSSASSSQPE